MEGKKTKEPQYTEPGMMSHLAVYSAVGKYRSIGRAIRKGHVTSWGEEVPKRPFNNRKRTSGRELQISKEKIYGELKYRSRAV